MVLNMVNHKLQLSLHPSNLPPSFLPKLRTLLKQGLCQAVIIDRYSMVYFDAVLSKFIGAMRQRFDNWNFTHPELLPKVVELLSHESHHPAIK
jgi:hypothetical protein